MKTGYRVCDAMTRKPIAVSPNISVKEAAQLMQRKDVGSLVVKQNDQLKGYITEQGLVHKIIARGLPDTTLVSDVMITNVATIGPEADVFDALMEMSETEVKQLPVLEGQKLVGLLTVKDILKLQPQLFDLIVDKIRLREPSKIASAEGTCDSCGNYRKKLFEKDSEFLCIKCRDTRKLEAEY